jgi:hypothetical protein
MYRRCNRWLMSDAAGMSHSELQEAFNVVKKSLLKVILSCCVVPQRWDQSWHYQKTDWIHNGSNAKSNHLYKHWWGIAHDPTNITRGEQQFDKKKWLSCIIRATPRHTNFAESQLVISTILVCILALGAPPLTPPHLRTLGKPRRPKGPRPGTET